MKKQFFIYLIMILLTGCTFQWNGASIDSLANFIDDKPNIKCKSEPWKMTLSIERPDNFDFYKLFGGKDKPTSDGDGQPQLQGLSVTNLSSEELALLTVYYERGAKMTKELANLAVKIGCDK